MPKKSFLKKPTSIRIDNDLRESAEIAAHATGMTFSAFTRQSLVRNIRIAMDIERDLNERNSKLTCNMPPSDN